ncbi:hypothetical protein V5O48_013882 [Marasmius crinis-equi]|uniref:Class E vacuolar protein-sorting machinery protein HSE1 n=1 Tax=Marasmius crinis-equi TaxID=585013 RepID=A0ABR3EZ82_9AGAR
MDGSKAITLAPKWNESMFTQVWGNVDYPATATPRPSNQNESISTRTPSPADLPSPEEAPPQRSDHSVTSADDVSSESGVEASRIEATPAHILPSASPTTPPPTNMQGVTVSPRPTRNPLLMPFSALRSRFSRTPSTVISTRKPFEVIPQASTSTERHGQARRGMKRGELTRAIGFLALIMSGFLTATASDWALLLDVCDRASANEDCAKEAVLTFRREFKYGQPQAQLSAARLWAIMLRNSPDGLISQSTSRKFLDTLEDLLSSSRTNSVVKERVLDVVAAAAYASRSKIDVGFRALWKKCKPPGKPDEGIPFATDDAMFEPPIVIHSVPKDEPPLNDVAPDKQGIPLDTDDPMPNPPVPSAIRSVPEDKPPLDNVPPDVREGPRQGPQTEDELKILFHVKALYSYAGELDEDFSFQAGDIIAVTATPNDGWWSGHLVDENKRQPGKHVFPSNFVVLPTHSEAKDEPPLDIVAHGVREETGQEPQANDGDKVLFHVKALYDWEATIDEDISFKAGDIISVTATPDDGWWRGYLVDENKRQPGKHAFPSNFVVLSTHSETKDKPPLDDVAPDVREVPEQGPQTDDGIKTIFRVKALYDWEATIDKEISFKAGDIIAVTATPDDGWWSGYLVDENKRQPGKHVFPSNFVDLYHDH